MRVTWFLMSVVAVLTLWGVGCASPNGGGSVGASAGEEMDQVARSALRERALETLETAASADHPLLRANAIEGLQQAPSRVEPFVRAGLKDPNLGVRFAAAMTVGELKLEDSAPFVEPLLEDDSPQVRAAAIYALRRLGRDVDPTPLAGMLRHEKAEVRAQAAFVLGELGERSAIPMLKDAAARDVSLSGVAEERIMRLQIAEALVKLGEDEAIETVRAALYPSRPEDLEVTALAVQIIGQVQDRRSRDQLIYLTAQQAPPNRRKLPAEVRLAAAASLAQLGQREGAFIADEYKENSNPAVRAQAAFVYGETGNPANLGKLRRMLEEDESPMVRVAAATAILKVTEESSQARG